MALFFTLNGGRIIADRSDKFIVRTITTTSSLQCPQHHKAPMVVVDNATYDYPGLRVSGCCQDFLDTIAERLK